MSNLVPMVLERSSSGERAMDIYSRLLRDRVIMLDSDVNEHSMSLIVAQMLYLEAEDPESDIIFYINSPGGSVIDGLSLLNTMNYIKCDVMTVVTGQACSMGSLLASCGAKGKRYMLPYSRHMIHQVSAGTQGTAIDMKITLEETIRLNKLLTEIYVESTGQSYETLERDMSRDFYMTPNQAIAYGLADKVIENRDSI